MAFDAGPAMADGGPLRRARRLAALALLLPLGTVAAIGGDILLRAADQDRVAIEWMQRLDLSLPALWPAGTPQRHPETLSPAVDLRLTPCFGLPGGGRPSPLVECGQGGFSP